jgi:hypothetical protein
MQIIEMNSVPVKDNVGSMASAPLIALLGQIVYDMPGNPETAEHGIAIKMSMV